MNINELTSVYFIGIGGIGMSALARYFNMRGIKVRGYDKTETVLTKKLVSEGIEVHYQDEVNLLPSQIDLVVYTPAVPKDHKQLTHIKSSNTPLMKRAQLLGLISESSKTIAVAGTHGKTTTSCMIAHVLKDCGVDISAFLGGIMSGYETNYFLGKSDWVVAEADEFDRSFLWLNPEISIINSMDADHLDIYGNDESVKTGFKAFLQKTRANADVFLSEDTKQEFSKEELDELKSNYGIHFFGFDSSCSVRIHNMRLQDGRIWFEINSPFGNFKDVKLRMPGHHNVKNATVALVVGAKLGIDIDSLKSAIENFKGIKRRFEWIVENESVVYIDDYAHHPTELNAAISAVRQMYPGKKVLGIFQPHLYSRTKDFAVGFAEELDKLDRVILMDIYPARELPIQGVTSNIILERMKHKDASLLNPEQIYEIVKKKEFDVIITLGAGDIDLVVPNIKRILESKE